MKSIATHALPIFLGLLLLSTFAAAEVGVFDFGRPGPSPGPYIGGKVIDDSEPWPSRLRPSGTTEQVVRNRRLRVYRDTRIEMLRLESGVTLRVWAMETMTSGSGHDLVLSRFEDGSWTVPQTLLNSLADELDPRLAVDPADGSVHLVYWVNDEWPRVMHTRAPADLSSWSVPQRVSEPFEYAVRPFPAFDDGRLVVAYEAHTQGYGGTPRQIVLATRESWGFSTEVVAATHFDGPNVPELHGSVDTLSIVWIDDASTMGMTWRQGQGAWAPVSGVALAPPASGPRVSGPGRGRRSGGQRD